MKEQGIIGKIVKVVNREGVKVLGVIKNIRKCKYFTGLDYFEIEYQNPQIYIEHIGMTKHHHVEYSRDVLSTQVEFI